ncbi:MAG: IPT/TIG domain-containing protein, partial [Phaeodactylibacter sp.]|nr:IPT/TIG domain-containing protein [Phaeodactylibacter sp.]
PDSAWVRPGGLVSVSQWPAAVHEGVNGLQIGRRADGPYTVNALDLHVNIAGYQDLELRFWLADYYDDNQEEDGIYFSDDGGISFKKAYSLTPASYPDLTYREYIIPIDSLILEDTLRFSNNFVIRFQQADAGDFNANSGDEDGFFIDDVSITGAPVDSAPVITYFTPPSGPPTQEVTVKGRNFEGASQVQFNGTAATFDYVDANTILAIVPAGATTGLITVATPQGTAYSPYPFIVTAAADIALTQLVKPASSCELSNQELVTIKIRNAAGLSVDRPFEAGYSVNGGTAVIETIDTPLAPDEELLYTFMAPANLSSIGEYQIRAFVSLENDENPSNDERVKTIRNHEPFEAEVTESQSICKGDGIILEAFGGASYSWNNGLSGPAISVAPAQSATYTVTVVNDIGCTDVQAVAIEVIEPPVPTITVLGGDVLCPGESITLLSDITDNILWSNNTFGSELEVSQPGNYYVTYYDPSGCITRSETISIPAAPPLSIQPSGVGTICLGDSEALAVPGAVSLQWSTGQNSTFIEVSPAATTTYSVTATDSYGCTSMDEFTVEVLPNEAPGQATNLLPLDGAQGLSPPVTLSWAPAANASHYALYLWQEGQTQPATPTVPVIPRISYALSGLQYATAYNWYVTALNSCQEGEPSTVQTFTVSQLPDLVVENARGPQATAFSGTEISIEWEVRNIGLVHTGNANWIDVVYLSEDTLIDAGDLLLGGQANPSALIAGQGYANMRNFTLPQGLEGEYYILVRADHYGYLAESDELNNAGRSENRLEVQLTPPPDLRVLEVLPPGAGGAIFAGAQDEVEWTVKNQGFGPTLSGQWQDRVFISPDSTFNPLSATRLATVPHAGGLEPSQSYSASASITIPQGIEGIHYIHVLTDIGNAEYEHLFENNNRKRSEPFNVIGAPRSDLAIGSLDAADSASNGENILVSWPGRNLGASLNAGVQDAILLNDEPSTVGAVYLGGRFQPGPLPTDTIYNASQVVTIPIGFTGQHYLLVVTDYFDDISELAEDNNFQSRPITILSPNLVVHTINTPPTATSGQNLAVNWQVGNTGEGTLFNTVFRDQVYLSPVPNPGANDLIPVGTREGAATILSGDTINRQKQVAIPDGISGPYYVAVRTNALGQAYEAGRNGDNLLVSSQPVDISLADYPDLRAVSITPAVMQANAGDNLSATFEVANEGPAAAVGAWQDRVYLSGSPAWPGFGNALLLKTVPRSQVVPAGQSYSKTLEATLPHYLPAGAYYLYLAADAQNTVYEHDNEGDNIIRSEAIEIERYPVVDLSLQDPLLEQSISIGQPARVRWTVTNIGDSNTPVSSWTDAIYLSANNQWNPEEDLLIRQWPRNAPLSPGQSYTRLESFIIPANQAGSYYLILVADTDSLALDDNYSNNIAILSQSGATEPVIIDYPPAPDLEAGAPDSPGEGIAGQPITIHYTVVNRGESPAAGYWKDGLFLSTNTTVEPGDIFLGQVSKSRNLAPGGNYTDSLQAFLPATASGNYYLLALADYGNALLEETEANNTGSSYFRAIQLPPADLQVRGVVAPPDADIGAEVAVSWTVFNDGDNPAAGIMKEGVYLSTDTIKDADDVLLGTLESYLALSPGQAETHQLDVRLEGAAMQGYYVLVSTDLENNIIEDDEENNTAPSILPIIISVPELPIGTLTPAQLAAQRPIYYHIEVPSGLEGEALLLSLDSENPEAFNELYLRFGAVPTRAVYDFGFDTPFSASQRILVPGLRAGRYYLMAYAVDADAVQDINLLAEIIPFSISTVEASQGGNTGSVTVRLRGARFEEQMEVFLESEQLGIIPAASYLYINSNAAFATFNLQDAPLGIYDVRAVKDSGDEAVLSGGFEVVEGTIGNNPLSL